MVRPHYYMGLDPIPRWWLGWFGFIDRSGHWDVIEFGFCWYEACS